MNWRGWQLNWKLNGLGAQAEEVRKAEARRLKKAGLEPWLNMQKISSKRDDYGFRSSPGRVFAKETI